MESPPVLNRETISKLVGTKVKNIELYQRAFTHKSALKRYSGLTGSYETLEFMGDSVLSFIVTRHLFDKYEKEQEGFMTKARTKMVRGTKLCEISRKLGLAKYVIMDEKGEQNNWNTNEHIMEDVFEALVAAIYMDLGMIHARDFVLECYKLVDVSLTDDNYKDQLMRWCQALKYPLPDYAIVSQTGGQFGMTVSVNGMVCGFGAGLTKRQAEQNAAEIVLKTDPRFMNKNGGPESKKNRKPGERTTDRRVRGSEESGVAEEEGGADNSE
jgi:ribonuclease-3